MLVGRVISGSDRGVSSGTEPIDTDLADKTSGEAVGMVRESVDEVEVLKDCPSRSSSVGIRIGGRGLLSFLVGVDVTELALIDLRCVTMPLFAVETALPMLSRRLSVRGDPGTDCFPASGASLP
jgi:hypothetical protein